MRRMRVEALRFYPKTRQVYPEGYKMKRNGAVIGWRKVLSNLAWWTLNKLGALQQFSYTEEAMETEPFMPFADVNVSEQLAERIDALLLDAWSRRLRPHEVTVLVGNHDMQALVSTEMWGRFERQFHDGINTWRGVRLVVVPYMEGVLVVPKDVIGMINKGPHGEG